MANLKQIIECYGKNISAGFDIADYITTYYQGDEDISNTIETFADYIKQETLSRDIIEDTPDDAAYCEEFTLEGKNINLGVKRQ